MSINNEEFLKSLGLTEKESLLYLSGLKHGPQTASMMSKKTGIPRSTVDFVFNQMIGKGFATKESRANTTYFSVIPPESIEYLLMEKQAYAKRQIQDFKEILPALSGLKNRFSPNPKVRYYEGYEGLCRILDDFCSKDQSVFYISSHNNMHPKIRKYVKDVYLPISNRHENKNKIILNEGEKAREYENLAKDAYDEFIFTDPKDTPFTLTTAVYGDKTAFWSYDPEDMSGIIIENRLIAENTRVMFGELAAKNGHELAL